MSAASAVRASRRRFSGAGSPGAPDLFFAPFAIPFTLFRVAPVVVAVVNSLFSRQSSGLGFGGSTIDYVGLDNYIRAFGDAGFLAGFPRVLLDGVVQVPLMMIIAAGLALLF